MEGYRLLQEKQQYQPEHDIVVSEVEPYIVNSSHTKYLDNSFYHQYLKMHKVTLGESGYEQLERIGSQLEHEYMPQYLDSAGWSYAEIALYDRNRDQSERHELLDRANSLWELSLERTIQLGSYEYSAVFDEADAPHRVATSIAFTPLMGALIDGDVRSEVRNSVFRDVAHIAKDVSDQITRAEGASSRLEVNSFSGLLHELNALMALLYIDDPRYVPLPATARSDSGYYHREQTHDISLINQHWGVVKKVLPIEIKARPTARDRRRYNALIVRGKMHLTPDGVDPRKTTRSFYDFVNDTASLDQVLQNDRLAGGLRSMLVDYQRSGSVSAIALNSLTKFYDGRKTRHDTPRLVAV